MDYDLYARLTNLVAGRTPIPADPRQLSLRVTPQRQGKDAYHAGDRLVFTIEVDRPSHVTCFYEPTADTAYVIYPTHPEAPALLQPGQPVTVPGRFAPFDIVLDRPEAMETVRCIAEPQTGPVSISQRFARTSPTKDIAQELMEIRKQDTSASSETNFTIHVKPKAAPGSG